MTAKSVVPCVAHILPASDVGGTEVATIRVAHAAREHGYHNVAFILPKARRLWELFEDGGIPSLTFEPVEPSYRTPARFVANTRRLVQEFRVGTRLVHCADVPAAFYVGYAARLARVPLLCHVRNRYAGMSLRDRRFLLPVQKFVFVSADTWRHFAYRVRPGRGLVLYDGIDLPTTAPPAGDSAALRTELAIPEGVPVIGMVARVALQKDYPTLVKAATSIIAAYGDVRFIVVGDCSSEATYREYHQQVLGLAESSGIRSHFIFTDFRKDVARFVNLMDIVVLSTHWEGFPLVLLEAMACAMPAVATAVDGIPELVTDHETGRLFPHDDARILAECLLDLLKSPAKARAMGHAGQDHVARNFSRATFTRNVGRLYGAMLDSEQSLAP
ncbi:MAG TPA: glycosyltransferase [Methylomirabilota bacterium]|nr:glycosyltransferase [Methylomirabilota bacterium]